MSTSIRWKFKTESLFARLLVSFLVIVVLLAAINLWSYGLYQTSLRNEIIRYNTTNLDNMTESFEKHFRLINELVQRFYFSDNVQLLNKKNIDYNIADKVRHDIQPTITNPLLYIDEMFLYFKDSSLILRKDGSTRADAMFNRFYQSPSYPLPFWQNQFQSDKQFHIYPASDFTEFVMPGSTPLPKGKLIPIVIKNNVNSYFYITVMINAKKMVETYNPSLFTNFSILNEEQQSIYTSEDVSAGMNLIDFKQTFVKKGHDYYFYKKGIFSGLTYVLVASDKSMSSQIYRVNTTLAIIITTALALSILASIFFSIRFHRPVQQMIRSTQQINPFPPLRSTIREFKQLNEQMRQIVTANLKISEDLAKKTSFLRYYAYINKLKKIYHTNIEEMQDLALEESPYRLLIFDIKFKPHYVRDIEMDTQRAMYYINEFVTHHVSSSFSNTHTFQIENNQILSLIYTKDNEALLVTTLETIRQDLNLDHAYLLVTMAVSGHYHRSTQFKDAYEEALGLIDDRPFEDESLILSSPKKHAEPTYVFTTSEEHELDTYLHAGNASALLQWFTGMLERLDKKGAGVRDYYDLGKQIINRIQMSLLPIYAHDKLVQRTSELYSQLTECYNVNQLTHFMNLLFISSATTFKQKLDERDRITSFVIEYLEHHYAEDITLDSIAEKMNITGGYLSTYFKEKTGKNFSEYLHEIRIGKAKEYLLQSNMKINDIAIKSGYQNMNSFNRMFKKLTGYTPSQFRQSQSASFSTISDV